MWEGLLLGHSSIRGAATIHCQATFVREVGKWPSCANLHGTFRLFKFGMIVAGIGRMECKKQRVLKTTNPLSGRQTTPSKTANPWSFSISQASPVLLTPRGRRDDNLPEKRRYII